MSKGKTSKQPCFFFDHKEVVENLIRQQGLHEGLWRLVFEVGLSAADVNVLRNAETTLTPAGMVLIQRIGIMRTDEQFDLTVDAAIANPAAAANRRKRRKKIE